VNEPLPPVTTLYNRQILGEAVKLARWPLTTGFALSAEKRSQTCGSIVRLGLNIDDANHVSDIGLQVHACALGQASAAIVAQNIIGCDEQQLQGFAHELRQFLQGERNTSPPWVAYEMLAPARRYPARHASIMLPLETALLAIQKVGQIGSQAGQRTQPRH